MSEEALPSDSQPEELDFLHVVLEPNGVPTIVTVMALKCETPLPSEPDGSGSDTSMALIQADHEQAILDSMMQILAKRGRIQLKAQET